MTDTAEILKASDWIEHDGKGMPVDGGVSVTVRYANGYERTDAAYHMHADPPFSDWVWSDEDDDLNIVAYRVLSKAITAAEEAGR